MDIIINFIVIFMDTFIFFSLFKSKTFLTFNNIRTWLLLNNFPKFSNMVTNSYFLILVIEQGLCNFFEERINFLDILIEIGDKRNNLKYKILGNLHDVLVGVLHMSVIIILDFTPQFRVLEDMTALRS